MSILVIAETHGEHLAASTYHTLSAAQAIAANQQAACAIDILVAGSPVQSLAEAAAHIPGVQKVLYAEAAVFAHPLAEPLAELVLSVAKSYTYILAPATGFGKNFMPRVAAKLDVAQISDISEVVSMDTFVRPIYAGNALATVQSSDAIKVITVRATAFPEAAHQGGQASLQALSVPPCHVRSHYQGQELVESARPELTSARVIIAGGRGMQKGENFVLLEKLADKLGAAIGASRAAVDAGFVPNDYQIGQTGKVVAPELYIAVGISGAIQHIAGMKDSKVIVVINKDSEAPIFQIADYGLVGDLFTILPELEAALGA